jgi:hypothetical protein
MSYSWIGNRVVERRDSFVRLCSQGYFTEIVKSSNELSRLTWHSTSDNIFVFAKLI